MYKREMELGLFDNGRCDGGSVRGSDRGVQQSVRGMEWIGVEV